MVPFRRRPLNAPMKLGLATLVLASLSLRYLHPSGAFTRDWVDGVQGLLYGVAIGTMLLGVWRSGRGRSSDCAS